MGFEGWWFNHSKHHDILQQKFKYKQPLIRDMHNNSKSNIMNPYKYVKQQQEL